MFLLDHMLALIFSENLSNSPPLYRQLEKEEEERQVKIMEAARVNGLKKEEEREKMKREANLLAGQALNKQIEEQQILREHKFNEKRKVS